MRNVQATAVRHKRGGLYFEDFTPGELVEHPLHPDGEPRMDLLLVLQHDAQPPALQSPGHFSASRSEWGQPLMNSLFTLG